MNFANVWWVRRESGFLRWTVRSPYSNKQLLVNFFSPVCVRQRRENRGWSSRTFGRGRREGERRGGSVVSEFFAQFEGHRCHQRTAQDRALLPGVSAKFVTSQSGDVTAPPTKVFWGWNKKSCALEELIGSAAPGWFKEKNGTIWKNIFCAK